MARSAAAASGSQARELAEAAGRMAGQGFKVALTGCIWIPEDEIGLYLFQAQSAEAVRDAAACCGVRFERLVEAVSGLQPVPIQHRT